MQPEQPLVLEQATLNLVSYVSAVELVSSDLSEELVYGITKALWNDNTRKLLDNGHAKGKQITLESALDGIAALGVRLDRCSKSATPTD